MIRRARSHVEASTISKCFRHAHFNKDPTQEEISEPSDDLQQYYQLGKLASSHLLASPDILRQYLAVDDNLAVVGPLTTNDILAEVEPDDVSELAEHQDLDGDPSDAAPPKLIDARQAICTLRSYVQSLDSTQNEMNHLDYLDDFLDMQAYKNFLQSRITDFFSMN